MNTWEIRAPSLLPQGSVGLCPRGLPRSDQMKAKLVSRALGNPMSSSRNSSPLCPVSLSSETHGAGMQECVSRTHIGHRYRHTHAHAAVTHTNTMYTMTDTYTQHTQAHTSIHITPAQTLAHMRANAHMLVQPYTCTETHMSTQTRVCTHTHSVALKSHLPALSLDPVRGHEGRSDLAWRGSVDLPLQTADLGYWGQIVEGGGD